MYKEIKMRIFILAGGFATRLWPITEQRAKPLLVLNGKTILQQIIEKIPTDWSIYILTNENFRENFAKEIKKYATHPELKQHKIFLECESTKNGEKIGALRSLSQNLKKLNIQEDIGVLAGDNLIKSFDTKALLPKNHQSANIVCREVAIMEEAKKFGVVSLDKNQKQILKFEEKPSQPKSQFVSTGFFGIGRDTISLLHEAAEKTPDEIGRLFTYFLTKKILLHPVIVKSDWFDVGSFESYLEAHKTLQTSKKIIQKSSKVQNLKTEGKVYIGHRCIIKNTSITNSIIYDDVVIKNAHISNSVIDSNGVFDSVDISNKLIRTKTHLDGR